MTEIRPIFLPTELEILVYWIRERERIRAAKEAGAPKPWTADELLRDYRWCNVRRMDDRVSRWLFERWYDPETRPQTQLTAALLARLINWPDSLADITGEERWWVTTFDGDYVRAKLQSRVRHDEKVFTGAYVVPGVAGQTKVDSVCALVEKVSKSADVFKRTTMAGTWEYLTRYDGLGTFLAGQVVADLAFLPMGLGWLDRETWAPLGPGSRRGMNRLLGNSKDAPMAQREFERLLPLLIEVLRIHVSDIWNDRGLVSMDVQNCLCEFDKYRRLTLGEGKVRSKYDGRAIANAPADPQGMLV